MDIVYLYDEFGFEGFFLEYLCNFKFKGNIFVVKEGEFVFKIELIF